jgi:hypothetical protein
MSATELSEDENNKYVTMQLTLQLKDAVQDLLGRLRNLALARDHFKGYS